MVTWRQKVCRVCRQAGSRTPRTEGLRGANQLLAACAHDCCQPVRRALTEERTAACKGTVPPGSQSGADPHTHPSHTAQGHSIKR